MTQRPNLQTRKNWHHKFSASPDRKLPAFTEKVPLNRKETSILSINVGFPQESIIKPLFFLIFINYIVTEVGCSIKLFADDTSIHVIIENAQMDDNNLNENILTKIQNWSEQWLVHFNPQKTEAKLKSRKQSQMHHPTLIWTILQ